MRTLSIIYPWNKNLRDFYQKWCLHQVWVCIKKSVTICGNLLCIVMGFFRLQFNNIGCPTIRAAIFISVFFIKFRFIPIRTHDQSHCPRWCSSHLLTDGIHRYILTALNNKFVMHMTADKTM